MNRDELLRLYTAGEREFSGVDLSGVKLKGVELIGVNFSNGNLSNANLAYADILRSNLQQVKKSVANLDNTRIDEWDLTDANLIPIQSEVDILTIDDE